jgi:hypothetical protein
MLNLVLRMRQRNQTLLMHDDSSRKSLPSRYRENIAIASPKEAPVAASIISSSRHLVIYAHFPSIGTPALPHPPATTWRGENELVHS